MPVSSQAIMRTVPDTGMVDFIIVAAIWRAQNMVQEFERLPKWGEISAVPPIVLRPLTRNQHVHLGVSGDAGVRAARLHAPLPVVL